MHILLLTHYFDPEPGAPQRRWQALLERFALAGHQVDVICPPPHYPSGRFDVQKHPGLRPGTSVITDYGALVHRVGFLPHDGSVTRRTFDHLWTALQTYRTASSLTRKRAVPDVIVATAPAIETVIAGIALARRMGVPLVTEMRDAWPDLLSHMPAFTPTRGPRSTVKRWMHRVVTEMQRRASRVVVTTHAFAEILHERGVRNVAIVRNGTRIERYDGLRSRLASGTALRVLYMGNVGRSQGLDVALHAARRLRDLGRPIELRIVGPGFDLSNLKRLNEKLGGVADIREAVPAKDVRAHYQWADTIIVSLRNWEPFDWTVPSKLYEAMATGRHITAVLAGEAAEIVRSTGCGSVVQPGDAVALAALWSDIAKDPTRLAVSEAGREWVRFNADFDALAEHYLALLADVVAEGGMGAGHRERRDDQNG